MERSRVAELHFITHFDNIPGILAEGIHCHNKMKHRPHKSVADPEVQERRAGKTIPGGLRLHDYTNLYFDARNVMMYVQEDPYHVAVVRVDAAVLDEEGSVVSDRNAAAPATFRPVEQGIAALNEDEVYAEWWNDSIDSRQKRCAEFLVPRTVSPEYIVGLYVVSQTAKQELEALVGDALDITVNAHLFFR